MYGQNVGFLLHSLHPLIFTLVEVMRKRQRSRTFFPTRPIVPKRDFLVVGLVGKPPTVGDMRCHSIAEWPAVGSNKIHRWTELLLTEEIRNIRGKFNKDWVSKVVSRQNKVQQPEHGSKYY